MNMQLLNDARNPYLYGSLLALRRAARRAREIAVQTGTEIIISRNGVIEHIRPDPCNAMPNVQEPPAPYL